MEALIGGAAAMLLYPRVSAALEKRKQRQATQTQRHRLFEEQGTDLEKTALLNGEDSERSEINYQKKTQ